MKWLSVLAATVVALSAAFAEAPGIEAHLPSQAAADELREFAGADGAFLAAGLVKTSYEEDDLATLLNYPTDGVMILDLTGAQIKQALERSISLYPQDNASFLQLSGLSATFSRSAPVGSRITSVLIGKDKLDEKQTYAIAAPSSLARGGFGYFKIWNSSHISKTYESVTVEDVLRGKPFASSQPRWSSAP